MKLKLSAYQKAPVSKWICRTMPSRNYSIGEVFGNQEPDSLHIRAMRRPVAPDLLNPGIPSGNPLKEGP